MSYLIIDIETVPDSELPWTGDADKIPTPPHHKVVVIGALLFDNEYNVKRLAIIADGKSESEMLSEFTNIFTKAKPDIVTFNGRGFDLPVIAARCLRYGITFSHYYKSSDMRYRYNTDGHFDIMDYIADFGATKSTSLDTIAKLCGMPGKVGVEGKDVANLVNDGKLQEVKAYCLCDVIQTAAVFLRLQLVRGIIEKERYLQSIHNLIKCIELHLDLTPIAKNMNTNRLLLKE